MAERPRWLARSALVLGGLMAGLLLAEWAGRFAGVSGGNQLLFPSVDLYPRDLYVDADGLNVPNPKFVGTVRSLDYAVPIHFSEWGTRGENPSTEGPRWIAVGDSFTLALQVSESDTFVAKLSEKLNVEIINAGVDGYSTREASVRLAQLALTFPPKAVVLAFFTGNDLADNLRAIRRTPTNPGRSPSPGGPDFPVHPTPPPLKLNFVELFLREHSVLFAHYLVWDKQQKIASGRDRRSKHFRDELEIFGPLVRQKLAHDMPATNAALAQFAATATRAGAATTYVVVLPPAFGLDPEVARVTLRTFGVEGEPDVNTAYEAILAAVSETGMLPCDARPELRATYEAGKNPYFLFDAHLTAEGHTAVANAIFRCVTESTP